MNTTGLRATYALEADLQEAVEDYLSRRRDIVWTRTDAGGKAKRARGRNVRKGWADVTVIVNGGRAVLCELKREKGKERPEQAELRERVTRMGGIAIVARCVMDVHEAVERAMG